MFSFLVKRILSGFLIVVLVSILVYALFWYGPKSPALELCRRDTNNRCDRRSVSRSTRSGWATTTRSTSSTASGPRAWSPTARSPSAPPPTRAAPCLGLSFRDRSAVTDQLKDRFPVTLSIAVGAATLYLLIGVTTGVAWQREDGARSPTRSWSPRPWSSARCRTTWWPCCQFLLLTLSTNVFPDVGYTSIFDNPAKWVSGLLLVWLVMGVFGATSYTRYSRGAMVEALSEDYVRTAKAKGLKSRTVVVKHGLRSALVPVVTIFGLDVAFLLSGTVFTEKIFSLEGIGKWGIDATYIKDLPVVQATSLILAVSVVLMNVLVDIIYSFLDPRVRLS